ncbi:hypothetical protein MWH28_10455 [Natroniella sulfidigena]|uniref:hypothetical protein n=1 Tax=Natroniella sulfidigena TaxID=723921 RepID=UPI00200A0FFF|nr:hypothetical protein [Natroniella sulfidigena]MCK8817782.1 hypothetical protein [Natroniella sulfidigena]
MQPYNITKLLDLPDLIATDLLILDGVYVFIAESKTKEWECPNCYNVSKPMKHISKQFLE